VAAELAVRGAEVTLVDRGEDGGSTSERSFAWINQSNPDVDYLELRVRGVEAWGRASEAFGHPPWLALPGTLTWAGSEAATMRIERHAGLLGALGHGPGRLTVAEVRRREPDLVLPRGVETIYHFAGEGWVHTPQAIAAQLARGTAAGLRLRSAATVRRLLLDAAGRRVEGVVLASGDELAADVVLSAAGRFTGSLLRPAGVEVPMLEPAPGSAAVGVVVVTTPVRSGLRSVLHADGLSVRRDPDGRLVVHSAAHDAHAPFRGAVPESLGGEILARARRHVRHTEHARVEQARVCFRSLPEDGLPAVGRALDGLYVIATHSGVTLAPALAQLAANELIDGEDEAVLAPFRPLRFTRASP
jgi:glycine/D-amino acid oxidase-like deaminating enzyme